MKELSLHILDIVQNAIDAGADLIEVRLVEDLCKNTFQIEVKDNGRGMNSEMLERIKDPYYTSRKTRKVGLGIPLFQHTVSQAGGRLDIESRPGRGCRVKATLDHQHIDRPVLGDMAGVMAMLAGANPGIDFVYAHRKDGDKYVFDTREVKQILDGMPLSELPVIRYLKEMIRENIEQLGVE